MDVSNLPDLIEPGGIALTIGGFVGGILRAILKGQLIPRSTHEDRVKGQTEQTMFYKTAYEAEKLRGDELVAMVRSLMEVGLTTQHVVRSLGEVALGSGGAHGPAESAPSVTAAPTS